MVRAQAPNTWWADGLEAIRPPAQPAEKGERQ